MRDSDGWSVHVSSWAASCTSLSFDTDSTAACLRVRLEPAKIAVEGLSFFACESLAFPLLDLVPDVAFEPLAWVAIGS